MRNVFSAFKTAWAAALLMCAFVLLAKSPPKEPVEAAEKIEPLEIGSEVEDFTLLDVREKELVSMGGFEEARAFALAFLSVDCPASDAYLERLTAFHEAFRKRGVLLLGVYSNDGEMFSAAAAHAEKHELPFPALLDVSSETADQLKAAVTPELFLIQAERIEAGVETAMGETGAETDASARRYVLRYSGAVDDSAEEEKVEKRYLEAAAEALLSGEAVAEERVEPSGCPIKRADKDAARKATP